MKIDLTTLAIFQGIIFLAEGALFAYQSRAHPISPAVKYWLTGSFLLGAGMLSMMFVPYEGLKVLALPANSLLIAGLLFLYAGIRHLYNLSSLRWTITGFFTAWALLYYWFMFGPNDLAARTLMIHLGIFTIALASGLTILQQREKSVRSPEKFSAWIFLGYAAFSLFILTIIIPHDNTYSSQHTGLVIAFMYPAFFSILWTFGLSGILTHRRNQSLAGRTPVPLSSLALSTREHEIAVLLLQGLSYDEISARSFISKNTVKTHAKNIYAKFDVKSRVELMRNVAPEAAEHPPPQKPALVSHPARDRSDEF